MIQTEYRMCSDRRLKELHAAGLLAPILPGTLHAAPPLKVLAVVGMCFKFYSSDQVNLLVSSQEVALVISHSEHQYSSELLDSLSPFFKSIS